MKLSTAGSHWPPPDDDLLQGRRVVLGARCGFEPDTVSEAHGAATGQHESIAKEERVRISDDLSGQEKIDLAVRAWGAPRSRADIPHCGLQATSLLSPEMRPRSVRRSRSDSQTYRPHSSH